MKMISTDTANLLIFFRNWSLMTRRSFIGLCEPMKLLSNWMEMSIDITAFTMLQKVIMSSLARKWMSLVFLFEPILIRRPYWTVLLPWCSYWVQISRNAWRKNCPCQCHWASDEFRSNVLYAGWSFSSLSPICSTLFGQKPPWSIDCSTWADRVVSTIIGSDTDRLHFMGCDKRPCVCKKTSKFSSTQRCY